MIYKTITPEFLAEFTKLIRQSKTILLHLHPHPDRDSIGSSLALHHYLTRIGKDVHLIKGDSELKNNISIFPGHQKIELMSYGDLDLSRFDLFIILDSGGTDRITELTEVKFPPHLKTINIDHHRANNNFADFNLVIPQSTSTSEILFDLFSQLDITITSDMAVCLYFGICHDTNDFNNLNTTPRSLLVASKLAKKIHSFIDFLQVKQSDGSVEDVNFVKLALNNLKEYFGGKVAISSIPHRLLAKSSIGETTGQKTCVAQYLRTVPKWIITVSMAEMEKGICGLSLRSSDPKWNVAKIAQATGKGGGHPVASGATIYHSTPKALKILLGAIQTTYPELGSP